MSKKIEQKLIKDIQQLSNLSINDKPLHQLASSIQTTFTTYIEKPKKQKFERKANETGLGKDREITVALVKFLQCKGEDTKSRNGVTKIICDYIKDNNLQDPEAKKYFICDKPLMDLLGLKESEKRIAYTELQTALGSVFLDETTIDIYKCTDELLKFVKDGDKDELISLFKAKRLVSRYVKEQNLKNKRKIILDDPLKHLFKVDAVEITQPQFERYIKDALIQVKDPSVELEAQKGLKA